MKEFLKKNWMNIILMFALITAMFMNRSVKLSIMENVFIEVGGEQVGPPEFYEKVIQLKDGRTIYIYEDSCKVGEE
jgi:hypothetical protein